MMNIINSKNKHSLNIRKIQETIMRVLKLFCDVTIHNPSEINDFFHR